MNFHGRRPELLEIYSTIARRVGNVKNTSLNNFKMLKTTIHEFYESLCFFFFFVDYTILKLFNKSFLIFSTLSAIVEEISSNLALFHENSSNSFFKKLLQWQNIKNVVSLRKNGLQILNDFIRNSVYL